MGCGFVSPRRYGLCRSGDNAGFSSHFANITQTNRPPPHLEESQVSGSKGPSRSNALLGEEITAVFGVPAVRTRHLALPRGHGGSADRAPAGRAADRLDRPLRSRLWAGLRRLLSVRRRTRDHRSVSASRASWVSRATPSGSTASSMSKWAWWCGYLHPLASFRAPRNRNAPGTCCK